MRYRHWLWMLSLATMVVLWAGCGRPTLPGQQFQDDRVQTATEQSAQSPLPEEPVLEWGNPDAKVRVVAFYPIDDEHQPLMDLLKGLADKYPGKVYVKYVDYRTPAGRGMFARTELTVRAVLINGESTHELKVGSYVRDVDFVQEIGRFWTADNLREAVAKEVEKAYGAGSGSTS